MEAWQRATTFLRTVDQRAAEKVVPYRWGRALLSPRLGLVHDLNYLIADRLEGATAEGLIEEADRIQGDAGLGHRRVNVDDQNAAERLAGVFSASGYQPERFVVMVLRRPVQRRPADVRVEEVGWNLIRPARRLARLRQPWGREELVEQILAKYELTASCVETRYFAALVNGEVASSCELRTEGGTAQVETVETLEEFRNRGLARAVLDTVSLAAAGHEFVFLVTDLEDWPQDFYRRLGFEAVGLETRFLRILD